MNSTARGLTTSGDSTNSLVMTPGIRSFLLAAPLCLHAQPAFEVASIRPAAPGAHGGGIEITPGGRFSATNSSLRALLKYGYQVRDFQIAEPPAWFDSQRYDVLARAETEAPEDDIRIMLQSLLADRFQLKLHRESKEMQAYVLTISKTGVKIQPVKTNETGRVSRKGLGFIAGTRASMAQLAEALSDVALNGRYILDRPVLDRTGLSGVYDFMLTWTPESSGSTSDLSGPSLFTAVQEQLGLKLESQKAQVEILAIDHVEKASAN
jgi:uncharacterized protein (TIGR03435 family)